MPGFIYTTHEVDSESVFEHNNSVMFSLRGSPLVSCYCAFHSFWFIPVQLPFVNCSLCYGDFSTTFFFLFTRWSLVVCRNRGVLSLLQKCQPRALANGLGPICWCTLLYVNSSNRHFKPAFSFWGEFNQIKNKTENIVSHWIKYFRTIWRLLINYSRHELKNTVAKNLFRIFWILLALEN